LAQGIGRAPGTFKNAVRSIVFSSFAYAESFNLDKLTSSPVRDIYSGALSHAGACDIEHIERSGFGDHHRHVYFGTSDGGLANLKKNRRSDTANRPALALDAEAKHTLFGKASIWVL